MENARPRRRYDATLRTERAAQTRARILETAHRVFLERGYAGATIPSIATQAGVAVETVYRAAPGKAGLLAAVVDAALAGGSENAALSVEARPGIRRVVEEEDPVRKLRLYAATQPGVYRPGRGRPARPRRGGAEHPGAGRPARRLRETPPDGHATPERPAGRARSPAHRPDARTGSRRAGDGVFASQLRQPGQRTRVDTSGLPGLGGGHPGAHPPGAVSPTVTLCRWGRSTQRRMAEFATLGRNKSGPPGVEGHAGALRSPAPIGSDHSSPTAPDRSLDPWTPSSPC